MSERPSHDQLSPQLRNVLYLRCAGYSHAEIAAVLDLKRATVHTYIRRLNTIFLKGITDDAGSGTRGSERGLRLAYVLGLLHAGATVQELPGHLRELDRRVRHAQIGAPTVKSLVSRSDTQGQPS